jgi:hypothetical protein
MLHMGSFLSELLCMLCFVGMQHVSLLIPIGILACFGHISWPMLILLGSYLLFQLLHFVLEYMVPSFVGLYHAHSTRI